MLKGSIEWEYHPGEEFVLRFKPGVDKIVPEEMRRHFKEARKDILLAMRSLLDAAISKAEKAEKQAPEQPTRIEVE